MTVGLQSARNKSRANQTLKTREMGMVALPVGPAQRKRQNWPKFEASLNYIVPG